jgi:hypothetical protein
MATQPERTQIAVEYYKALRAETIERLKMRDAILLGYLTAITALIGYGLNNEKFGPSLVLLVPFLALGAAITIAQHQDQIAAFSEYISLQLAHDLPDKMTPVINFNAAPTGIHHLSHNLNMNLFAQLVLICGPVAFILWNYYPSHPSWSLRVGYWIIGLALVLTTGCQIFYSWWFRRSVMIKLTGRRNHETPPAMHAQHNKKAAH